MYWQQRAWWVMKISKVGNTVVSAALRLNSGATSERVSKDLTLVILSGAKNHSPYHRVWGVRGSFPDSYARDEILRSAQNDRVHSFLASYWAFSEQSPSSRTLPCVARLALIRRRHLDRRAGQSR